MTYVHVDQAHMLALFAGVEEEQPFRHQADVLLLIDFSEYEQFIQQVVRSRRSWLYLPFEKYEKAVSVNGSREYLKKLYYYDMSRAMLYETMKSGCLGCESTIMATSFNDDWDSSIVLLENANVLSSELGACNKAINSVKFDMAQFSMQHSMSKRNRQILEYVVFLRALSFERNPKSYEFSI